MSRADTEGSACRRPNTVDGYEVPQDPMDVDGMRCDACE